MSIALYASGNLESYDLQGLCEFLLNHEESKEQRKLNIKRMAKNAESALVVVEKKEGSCFPD